jgi:hypothetical protein
MGGVTPGAGGKRLIAPLSNEIGDVKTACETETEVDRAGTVPAAHPTATAASAARNVAVLRVKDMSFS